jgi:adenylylsulfate kinase-like enzyme
MLYDRIHERVHLLSLANKKPTRVITVLGPRSSGKSALAEDLKQTLKSMGVEVVLIDCRGINATRPAGRRSISMHRGQRCRCCMQGGSAA